MKEIGNFVNLLTMESLVIYALPKTDLYFRCHISSVILIGVIAVRVSHFKQCFPCVRAALHFPGTF